MKKITFTLLSIILLTTISYSQTVNTQEIDLSTDSGLEYSAQIEISSTTVTLTLIGPSDRWLGLGFDASSMTVGKDMVFFDGTNLTDRTFDGIGAPPILDAQEDWTILPGYPDINSGVVTVVATRDASGGPGDHKFSTSDTSIDLVWARGNGATFVLGYHGGSNRGLAMADFHPLSLDHHKVNTFSISPNPGRAKLNLKLSKLGTNTNLEVFDVLGKRIYANRLTDVASSIDVSKWNSGVYLVRVSNDTGVQTKRFVKQ
jgi:hypothetical protein